MLFFFFLILAIFDFVLYKPVLKLFSSFVFASLAEIPRSSAFLPLLLYIAVVNCINNLYYPPRFIFLPLYSSIPLLFFRQVVNWGLLAFEKRYMKTWFFFNRFVFTQQGEGGDKKVKKVTKTVDLGISAMLACLPQDKLNPLVELEAQMVQNDKLENDRINAKVTKKKKNTFFPQLLFLL